MFKIGAEYEITTCELGDDGYESTNFPHWTAKEVNGTTVKFVRDNKEWILNIASPLFVQAVPQAQGLR